MRYDGFVDQLRGKCWTQTRLNSCSLLCLIRRFASHVVPRRAAHFRSDIAARRRRRRRRLSATSGPESRDNCVDVTSTCSDDVSSRRERADGAAGSAHAGRAASSSADKDPLCRWRRLDTDRASGTVVVGGITSLSSSWLNQTPDGLTL